MFFTNQLPFDRQMFVCGVCGFSSTSRLIIDHCSSASTDYRVEEVPFSILQEVYIYTPIGRGRRRHRSRTPQPYILDSIYYRKSAPAWLLESRVSEAHRLCISLRAKNRPFTAVPHHLTYRDFLLWQKGDEHELSRAGLIQAATRYLRLIRSK